jgi:hypothetical protein
MVISGLITTVQIINGILILAELKVRNGRLLVNCKLSLFNGMLILVEWQH